MKDIDDCAVPCAKDSKCKGFHWYQDNIVAWRADGQRMCEHILQEIGEDMWTPLYKPNSHYAGLKIDGDWPCGEPAWDKDNGCRREDEESRKTTLRKNHSDMEL